MAQTGPAGPTEPGVAGATGQTAAAGQDAGAGPAGATGPDQHVPLGDFVFVSRTGFPTDFGLEPRAGYQPSAAEQAYIERLDACLAKLADLRPQNTAAADPDLQRQKEAVRDRAVRELRGRSQRVVENARGAARDAAAATETVETYRTEGRYREWMLRIDTTPFTVRPEPEAGPLFKDLRINTRDVRIPDDKGRLKVEIDAALTVTKIVFGERENAVSRWTYIIGQHETRTTAVRTRFSEYIVQLLGIAQVGLMNTDPTQAAFARQDLARYKGEFRDREAGTVKNRHIRRLGYCCLLAVLVLTVGYVLARACQPGTIPRDFRNFFLLAIGTAVGTWLSFSLRRQILTFDDLAVLEEDRLDSGIRVLFMIGLVTVSGLLFWAQAVNVALGDLDSAVALHAHGAWSLLIGMLAGIAERALATAVSRRATDFAAALGGDRPAPPAGGA
jgi:hypothetical protein